MSATEQFCCLFESLKTVEKEVTKPWMEEIDSFDFVFFAQCMKYLHHLYTHIESVGFFSFPIIQPMNVIQVVRISMLCEFI